MREMLFGGLALAASVVLIGGVLFWGWMLQRRNRTSVGSPRAYKKILQADPPSRLADPESTQSWLLTAERPQRVVEYTPRRLALPVAPTAAEPLLNALPNWAGDDTAEWSILDTYEAELVDVAAPEVSEAEAAFWADPLGSWVLPPEAEQPDFLPEAVTVFNTMVSLGRLTGIGQDIDAEWEAWNLEMVV